MEVRGLQTNISNLDMQINEVERNNDKHLDAQKKMLRQKDSEIGRSQDQ